MSYRILIGDCREQLRTLPDESVHAIVTSPPYFGLRDYGTGEWEGGDPDCKHRGKGGRGSYAKPSGESVYRGPGLEGASNRAHVEGAPHRGGRASVCECGARRIDQQIGLEPTPAEFVEALVEVFREVRRVLRPDGSVWLNLGDSYAGHHGNARAGDEPAPSDKPGYRENQRVTTVGMEDLKAKDLIGIPWMVAFALRADGWYLRSDVVWAKPNPMPESVEDRPTRSHEFLFLLTKQARYFYDPIAVREHDSGKAAGNGFAGRLDHRISGGGGLAVGCTVEPWTPGGGRNKRDVWNPPEELWSQFLAWLEQQHDSAAVSDVWKVTTKPYTGAHFAVFPPDLIEPCVLASSPGRACAACGAPWRRLVKRSTSYESQSALAGTPPEDVGNAGKWTDAENGGGNSKVRAGPVVTIETLGFEPSCMCHRAHCVSCTGECDCTGAEPIYDSLHPPVPGVVLDPFAGSGTVGVVCGWYGRDFVGIELNAEYAGIAEGRIAREGRPSRRRVEPVVVIDGQQALELL